MKNKILSFFLRSLHALRLVGMTMGVFLIFAFFPPVGGLPFFKVYAAEFTTNYDVEYNLSQENDSLNSKVRFNISITNLRSDVYVNRFTISFPKTFAINNLKVFDDTGEINPVINHDDMKTTIEMQFLNPNTGVNSLNNFYLTYDQNNLFKINGNIWEVILPIVENKQDSNYKVTVLLPTNTEKKISIAKPIPDRIIKDQIIWINPQGRTIYAVFGNNQIYETNLTYNLKNYNITPQMVEIAFPPDTLYQKIYLNSLNYLPNYSYQDEDKNYLAKYLLGPLEKKIIEADIFVELFSSPREEVIPVVRKAFINQKKYLLNEEKYWQLKDYPEISQIKTINGIYNYVVSKLKYNYKRVSSDSSRLGADIIMTKPDMAVCMEFADLFIAISREKGYFSREIEGYGNSSDPELRPLSLSSDILHAWPEYYSEGEGIWKQTDPTWENTSGIDYFTSFDLNHITFVVHGKKSDYPLPAGSYKIDNSKDISVKATMNKPREKINPLIIDVSISKSIHDNQKYQGKFTVLNKGNTYLYDIPVSVNTDLIKISKNKYTLDSLAPYEKKEIIFDYQSLLKNKKKTGKINIKIFNKKLYEQEININPYIINLLLKFLLIIGISLIGWLLFKSINKRK